MNDSMIPHLVVNRDYEALLAESKDENLCSYLRCNLASAKGLISDISARQSTLQRLICAVVACQRPFFTDGKSLQPMMMSEVAKRWACMCLRSAAPLRGNTLSARRAR